MIAIREARRSDAAALAELIGQLGYAASADVVRDRLDAVGGEAVLVAEEGERVIGCASLSVMRVLHRPAPVGRISMMVVAEHRRGEGIGSRLAEAAEAVLSRRGCGLLEVTSNRAREAAHAFYEALGYERTSYRFAKAIE